MADGSFDLQTTVYGVLNALDPPLAAGGVHAVAPQDHPLPYVEMGESDATQLDVERRTGLDEFLTIHVWTRFGSYSEVKDIMSRIRDALHQKRLTVEGRSAALSTVKASQVFADSDEQSLHGIISLRVAHWSLILGAVSEPITTILGEAITTIGGDIITTGVT